MSIDVIWHGHSATEIRTPMVRLLIDPFFTGNPEAVVKAEDMTADAIIVTHGHDDHLGDTIAIAKRCGALVISNFEIINYLKTQGLERVHALHIGGGHGFDWGRVKLTMAQHGSSLPDGRYGGLAAGVLLYLGGIRIYHAGDTGLFYDMKLIGEENIELALLPIGDNFTMGPDDALRAVKLLEPGLVVPIHYGAFEAIWQDPKEWIVRVMSETRSEAVVLAPGEVLTLGDEEPETDEASVH